MATSMANLTAITKILYQDGKIPDETFKEHQLFSRMKKTTNFKGASKVIALKTGNTTGTSQDFTAALAALSNVTYARFTITRVKHYTIARMEGEAMRAAKEEGSMSDAWADLTQSAIDIEMRLTGKYAYGPGTGTLGQLNGSFSAASTTATLATIDDAYNFEVGMRVSAAATDGGVLYDTGASIALTGVDVANGILTVAANWNLSIPSIAASAYLSVAGDGQNGGSAPLVLTGLDAWAVGGSSPGILFGQNRNGQPAQLAGQAYNASGVAMDDAVVQAAALMRRYGQKATHLFCHPLDRAELEQTLMGKQRFPSAGADVGVGDISIPTPGGKVALVDDPDCPRSKAYLVDLSVLEFSSLGPAPQVLDFDEAEYFRTPTADAYEIRVGYYGNMICHKPLACLRLTNFGA